MKTNLLNDEAMRHAERTFARMRPGQIVPKSALVLLPLEPLTPRTDRLSVLRRKLNVAIVVAVAGWLTALAMFAVAAR